MSKYTARYATYDEREEIVQLYVDNLWPISHLEPDLLTVIKSIYAAITDKQMLVVETAGKIVGCASFMVTRFWFQAKNMLFDTGFFIIKEFRKTRAGSVLFDALKKEAVARDMFLVVGAGTKDKTMAPILAKRFPQIATAYFVSH